MADGYITAAEAYDRLLPIVVGDPAYAINRRAQDGILTARASVLFWGNDRREDCEIPKEFWSSGGGWAADQNWRSGDFSTWIGNRLKCRAYGVFFLEKDIEAMMPATSKGQSNFAPAEDCVLRVCEHTGIDMEEAVQSLIRHCAAGLIASRCSRIWWRTTDRYEDQREEEQEGELPDWFWENCAGHADAIFDWGSGKVSSRTYIEDDDYKVIVEGLEFDAGSVDELIAMLGTAGPKVSLQPEAPTESARAGRKRDSEKWEHWTAELAAYIHENGIPEGHGAAGQDELIAAIDTRLTEKGMPTLGRTTVQATARAVLLRLRSAENGDSG